SKTYHWKSVGESKFQVEEIAEIQRGTKVYFKVKDEHKEYCSPYIVKNILKKYSNFVDFPIFVNGEEVNTVSALWHKPKDQLKEDELNEFYKFISNDLQPPLGYLHLSMEGNINFKALIFIPETTPQSLFQDVLEKSVQLYANRIFIQDDCKELLPDYLKFVKGVVDTEDLPLNVSREVVQASPITSKIRSIITTKILNLLEDWSENDKIKYEKFYTNFGSLFKTGVNSDYSNKEKILDLLRFETSEKPKGELISFKDYVKRMADDQKEIYYMLGDHREVLEKNPNLELFKKKGIEVLFLTDPVDIFTIPYIFDYDKKPLKSIDKADLNLENEKTDGTLTDEDSLNTESSKSIIEIFKETLGDKVEDVIVSKRLVDSAITLVVGQQGLDPQMEKIMQVMDKSFTVSKRILEINMSHPVIKNLSKIYNSDNKNPILQKSILQLYEGAMLLEGKMTSPADFVKRMTEFIEIATK
ncbi:MAG: molecular chaperone HtpG, partial [FCB group bacterium]